MTEDDTALQSVFLDAADLDRVRAGQPLVAHLEPEPAIETFDESQPPYKTAIALPYVVRNGDVVWGFSGPSILSHSPGKGLYGLNAFGFTNAGPFYAILSYDNAVSALAQQTVAIRLIHIATFHRFRMQALDRYATVWSSERPATTQRLRQAVEDGHTVRTSIEIEDGISLSAPVAAAYCQLTSDSFELRTHLEPFPAFALATGPLLEEIERRQPALLDASDRTAQPFHLNDAVLSTFVCASSDGTFYSSADIPSARRQRYAGLKVLAAR